MNLVHDITFAQAFSFKYSPRPGTPAAMIKPQLDDAVKTERLHALQQVLDAQLTAFNRSCVGKTFEILLTGHGRNPGQLVGKSPYLQAVHVNADAAHIGQIMPVTITTLESFSLGGVRADTSIAAE